MADDERKPRRLQVATMRPEDSGRGIARLPRAAMTELGLAEGDVIELVGKRATAARAVGPYPEDEGLEIIRLDGLQRANAELGAGDLVEIRKAESKPAHPGRLRPRAEEPPPAGLGPGAEAQLRDEAAHRRRRRRHHRPAAGAARRHPARASPDADRARLRASGDPPGRRLDRAQGHRPYRRRIPRSSFAPNIPRPRRRAAPTSPMTISAGSAPPSTSCARWSSCPCAIPRFSSGSASIRPRACSSTARPAPARPGSPARSPTRATPTSSTSPAPRSWARPMARARRGCASSSRQAGAGRALDHLHRRDRFRSRPSAARSRARPRSAWSRNCCRCSTGCSRARTSSSSPPPTGPRRSTRRFAARAASTARS